MPTYENSSDLHNDEWILFQIKEGPCSAGCDYCYENGHIRRVIEAAQARGEVEAAPVHQMTTLQLAKFTEGHKEELAAEMSLDEITRHFELLNSAGIRRAALIGSEPTSHSQYDQILGAANENDISLLVYTAGMSPEKLEHPTISRIVLHLDYGRLGEEIIARRIKDKTLPADGYMRKISRLLELGKFIDLRINFADPNLSETAIAVNFFEKLEEKFHASTQLKYSFSTRVSGEPDLKYFDPDTLRTCVPLFVKFIDEFKSQFPNVAMFSERPLFPCSFEDDIWQRYSVKGGLVSSCDMEFTFYPNSGLALCPPSRSLVNPEVVANETKLKERISQLRSFVRDLYRQASFNQCVHCPKREDLSCQGGCLGYKAKYEATVQPLVQIGAIAAA
jgi:pyruvate-formate lyase-activating enzyme